MWLLVIPGLVLLADLCRPSREQLSARVLIAGIRWYRSALSAPMATVGARCRFKPTCSRYAETAIGRHGAARGAVMAAGRMLRCGPWTDTGTADPVPR